MECLARAGADLNAAGENGCNPLRLAATRCHIKIIKFLAAAGANLDAAGEEGWTALHFAAETGKLGVVQCLVEAGAKIDPTLTFAEEAGRTPLFLAVLAQQAEVAEFLLQSKAKANPNPAMPPGTSSLILTAVALKDLQMITLLLEAGAPIGANGSQRGTPLTVASHGGSVEIVRYLVSAGANIDEAGPRGSNAIISASKMGHLEIVQYLVELGADIHGALVPSGSTAYTVAVKNGHVHVAEYLKSLGARHNITKVGSRVKVSTTT